MISFLSLCQDKRLGALNKFKAKDFNVLICTDVASRGLDIQGVDVVINYDIPMNSKVLTLFISVPVADQRILPFLLRRSCIFILLLILNLYCSECRIMYTGLVGLHVQGNQDMLYLW